MLNGEKCPVCQANAVITANDTQDTIFYACPVCGRFQLTYGRYDIVDNNKLAPYLYHNRFQINGNREYRYHTTLSKEICDNYKKEFHDGNNVHGLPVHMDADMIASWYPKSFSERVDKILLKLGSTIRHIGQKITIDNDELLSLTFVDRKELNSHTRSYNWRNKDACTDEARYMLDCLSSASLIKHEQIRSQDENYSILILTPDGYNRIDELQKNTSSGRNVLVAMKFGDETSKLREAIREGIRKAEYHAIFIDEVQHNDFITPELLKYIRDSKFVVVDLTHQNNGAYFEEGYAMGVGKPVIQLCQKDTKLHFDIAQKNTIMWKTEDEIPELLENRIRATID